MLDTDIIQRKTNFAVAWLIANAIGIGLAWPLGEWIGQQVADSAGWRIGQTVGLVIFEGLVWTARAIVLSRVKSYEILKPLEIIIWLGAEIMGWIVSEAPVRGDSLMRITGGAVIAIVLGAGIWIMFWFMKIPKRHNKFWAIQAFAWTFFALIGGSFLLGAMLVISLVTGETLAKMHFPIIGMAMSGIIFGLLVGSITGLAFIKIIPWQISEEKASWR
jgi:hypothetical protein